MDVLVRYDDTIEKRMRLKEGNLCLKKILRDYR
jgi:hypothetical protein